MFQAKRYASGPRPSPLISTLVDKEGQTCVTNDQKAKALFNATCVATSDCDLSDTSPTPFPQLPEDSAKYLPSPSSYFSSAPISDALKTSHPVKAPGPDSINNWVWKLAWEVIQHHVTILFISVTQLGYIPSHWKQAKTLMLAKPGKSDYTQPGAYRPIALLNTLSKIYKQILTRFMSHLAESTPILHDGHYGARPGRSNQDALIHLVSWIKAHWRAGRVVGAIFADLKSAFPSVHHTRMIKSLEEQGLHPEFPHREKNLPGIQRIQLYPFPTQPRPTARLPPLPPSLSTIQQHAANLARLTNPLS